MKCDSCKFNVLYHTGPDEQPPNTSFPVCAKGWWEDTPTTEADVDPHEDCPDYYPLLADDLFREIGFSRLVFISGGKEIKQSTWYDDASTIHHIGGDRFKMVYEFVGTRDEIIKQFLSLIDKNED